MFKRISSVIISILSAVWLARAPDWEPLIVFVGSISTYVIIEVTQYKKENKEKDYNQVEPAEVNEVLVQQKEENFKELNEEENEFLLVVYNNDGKATYSQLANLTSYTSPLIKALISKLKESPYRYLDNFWDDDFYRLKNKVIGCEITPAGTNYLRENRQI